MVEPGLLAYMHVMCGLELLPPPPRSVITVVALTPTAAAVLCASGASLCILFLAYGGQTWEMCCWLLVVVTCSSGCSANVQMVDGGVCMGVWLWY